MKITIILTAYKEERSIGKAIECLLDANYSGFNGEIELIQVSPDKPTLDAGKVAFESEGNKNATLIQIKDPGKGKPYAINLALKKISGELVAFTDGDVYFGKNALSILVKRFEEDDEIGAVTGRPVSSDPRSKMMGYFGHLFASANHYRRMVDLEHQHLEKGKLFVKPGVFFPLSGYIMAARRSVLDFELPEDVLADDAYISYKIFNKNYKLAYAPDALANIKYPKTLGDYFKQKKRSTGGYIQLWKYSVVTKQTKARNFWQEIQMFWFPFKFADNLKEMMWSIFLFPIRIYLWIQIYLDRKIFRRSFEQTWVRVESTK